MSIGAWLHEVRHAKDDADSGFKGLYILLYDKETRIQWERNVYNEEIELAIKLGYPDVAEKLKKFLDEEVEKIKDN